MRVDHGHGVIVGTHLGGANGMKNSGGNIASQPRQFLIGLELQAWLEFLRPIFGQCVLADDLAGHAQGVGGDLPVFRGAEVIGRNRWCVFKMRAFYLHRAPAGRVQVADTGGKCIEAVQRFAEGVERQGLNVVFNIWIRLVR